MTKGNVTNVLPHNPLDAKGLMNEVKTLKGDKGWLQWELECILAKYPGNKTLEAALTECAAAKEPKAPATKAEKPAPQKATKATKKDKTPKVAKEPQAEGPPLTDEEIVLVSEEKPLVPPEVVASAEAENTED